MGHVYGHINDTLKILHIAHKGKYMNILENFHIYNLSTQELHLNDIHTDILNLIYDVIPQII